MSFRLLLVLYERAGAVVAHCKFTLLLLPSGPVQITGLALPEGAFVPENAAAKLEAIDVELRDLLLEETNNDKKKKKKKSSSAAAAAAVVENA